MISYLHIYLKSQALVILLYTYILIYIYNIDINLKIWGPDLVSPWDIPRNCGQEIETAPKLREHPRNFRVNPIKSTLSIQVNHGKSWYMMIKHGNTWFIHGKSWSIMINYGHLWTSCYIFFPWTNHGNTWRIHGKMIESPRKSRRFRPLVGTLVTVPRPRTAGRLWAMPWCWRCFLGRRIRHTLWYGDVMVCPESRWWFSTNSEIGNLWQHMLIWIPSQNWMMGKTGGNPLSLMVKTGEDFATNPLTEMSYPPVHNDITWFNQETWWYNEDLLGYHEVYPLVLKHGGPLENPFFFGGGS